MSPVVCLAFEAVNEPAGPFFRCKRNRLHFIGLGNRSTRTRECFVPGLGLLGRVKYVQSLFGVLRGFLRQHAARIAVEPAAQPRNAPASVRARSEELSADDAL